MTTKENQIEQTLINRLVDLKYTYRPDIRNKVRLEQKFRKKFEVLILDRNDYSIAFDDGVKQTNLKKANILSCPLLLPADEARQQKIADCLSSLYTLIATQAKKLIFLKPHKKSLMQPLFPLSQEAPA